MTVFRFSSFKTTFLQRGKRARAEGKLRAENEEKISRGWSIYYGFSFSRFLIIAKSIFEISSNAIFNSLYNSGNISFSATKNSTKDAHSNAELRATTKKFRLVKRKNQSIIHVKINSKKNQTEKPKNKMHLQTVNNQHKQIRDFMGPFNGVATKYLPNYLNWFNYRQSQKENKEKVKSMMATCLSATAVLPFLIELTKNAILIGT